jgi:hypothetical protein
MKPVGSGSADDQVYPLPKSHEISTGVEKTRSKDKRVRKDHGEKPGAISFPGSSRCAGRLFSTVLADTTACRTGQYPSEGLFHSKQGYCCRG